VTLAALGSVVLASTTPGPAQAQTGPQPRTAAGVTVASFSFTPARVVVGLGDMVTWTFTEVVMSHTTTSDDGFWNSGPRSNGATFARSFATVGTYRYHCAIHPFMHGRVVVPLAVTGSAADGWHLRWAASMPAGFSVDVQVRRPGSTAWSPLRTRTTRLRAPFHPAKAGTYALRARSHRKAHTSGWTPVRTIQVS
jgi:plastocyanin